MKQINEIVENTINGTPQKLKNSEWTDIGEIWKDIPNYEGLYQVSNFGRVRSLDRIIRRIKYVGRILKQSDHGGYRMVRLSKHSKGHGYLVHRLVAISFLPNPDNLPDVNHKDLNKENNSLNNLEWINEQNNIRHAIKNGAMNHIFGVGNFRAILDWDKVKNIRKIYWESLVSATDLAKIYKISAMGIIDVINNNNWYDKEYGEFLLTEKCKKLRSVGRNSGSKNGAAKLDENTVLEIKRLLKINYPNKDIAKKFNIKEGRVRSIKNGSSWYHLSLP